MAERNGWWEQRFSPRAKAVEVICEQCSKAMWLPPSKSSSRKTCGPECAEARRQELREAQTKPCDTCGENFRARPTLVKKGQGRFCSQRCNTSGWEALQRPEVKQRSIETMRSLRSLGLVKFSSGEDHPQWKGGKSACVRRRIEDGRAAAELRRYRQANPDKVREFQRRREGRKVGKLPYGTIPKIRKMQRDKCAICKVSLNNGSHLDHIVPLAKGGKHEPRNLQLLCKPCNLRKSDRDPITHMQSLGRLL